MASRKQRPPRISTAAVRAADLTPEDVRFAARAFLNDDREPPAGLGPSRYYDVWIDCDGQGPKPFPAKVILAYATGGDLPEGEGYARNGAWRSRLQELGFPVLAKGKRPVSGQSCKGIDLQTESEGGARRSRAQPLVHAKARRELTREHVVAAALACADLPPASKPDTYDVWVGAKPYPFWSLYRAAMKQSGGVVRKSRGLLRGNQPEHDRLRALRFDVLPRGIPPVPGIEGATDEPSPELITVAALKKAAVLLARAPEFRGRREGRTVDLWIEGNGPYPLKAMCLLAWHSLGLGWHENWTKGGPASRTNAHLQHLPGVEILTKGKAPDSDGGRARAILDDLQAIEKSKVSETTRERLVDARLGQGRYRRQLEEHWGAACAVTGVSQREALRASHIVPWKESDNTTRLDPHNGLLLVVTLDCLFDKWLISFARDGKLLVGPIPPDEQRKLGLDPKMRLRIDGKLHLTSKRLAFLERHRRKFLELHGRKDRFANA
ncbi:HNH endonuclease [Cupriavidus sp. TMH.W2]|uniref:HNH endonuclease n=1 Tax=Cupriavidus sp. TMH.W2 TaxID=3434465 RepID=UPI003D7743DE